MQEAFRDKYVKVFSDVNFKHALVGAKVEHSIDVAGMAKFFLSFPTGERYHEVGVFAQKPEIKVKDEEATNLGPITETEEMLLLFLAGMQLIQTPLPPRQNFPAGSPCERLKYIRQIPVVTANFIADRCRNFSSLMEVILALDSKNS
jgi:hypothetical protein